MVAPSVVSISPANTAVGVVLSDTVRVVFDKEVDESTVQIIVEGPDTDRWSGPEQARWDDVLSSADDDILATPGYHGVVAGLLTFEKIDSDGDTVSSMDYTGGGSAWRSKVIFTPTNPFSPNTEYTVYIVGDEDFSDTIQSGVSVRTVFDVVKGANLEDGTVVFDGGYTGAIEDVLWIRVKQVGEAEDTLLFHWWKASSPLIINEGRTSYGFQNVVDGIRVRFDGDFEIDDEFSVVIKPMERMEDTYRWTFTTGSGSIIAVPSGVIGSTFLDGTAPIIDGTVTDETDLQVVSVTPANRATNLSIEDPVVIEIKFNKVLDADTFTDETVLVWAEPVNGDESIPHSGTLAKILSIVGDTLTIQIG